MTFRQGSADFTVQHSKFSNSDAQNTRLYFPPLVSCGKQTDAHRRGWPAVTSRFMLVKFSRLPLCSLHYIILIRKTTARRKT